MVGALGNRGTALTVQRYLDQATASVSTRFARLSSGSRINTASDDAAGVAIADRLRANSKTLAVASRNVSDGISVLSIADAALEQQSSILARLSELAEQSANGSFSSTQRQTLSKEYQTLMREYTRIAESTEFNNQRLLLGLRPSELNALAIQAGITGGTTGIVRFLNPDTGEYSGYVDTDTMEHVSDGGVDWATFISSSHTLEEILERFPNTSFLSSDGVGTDSDTEVLVLFGIDTSAFASGAIGISSFSLNESTGLYDASYGGALVTLDSNDTTRLNSVGVGDIYAQWGVDLSALRFVSSSATGLDASVLEYTGIESATRAMAALDALSARRNTNALDRANLGAAESRLRTAAGVLAASFENTLGAEARIRDVDVAAEVAELTRSRILQESSTAALKLVNQGQGLVLLLLDQPQ